MNEIGILPVYKGIAVHDCWHSYFTFCCLHALCGAHLLRELEGVAERDGQPWAASMKRLLLEAGELKEASPEQKLTPEQYQRFQKWYRTLLSLAEAECGMEKGKPGEKQGRPRRKPGEPQMASGKTMALIRRLREHEKDFLRYLAEPVPFSNNFAKCEIFKNTKTWWQHGDFIDDYEESFRMFKEPIAHMLRSSPSASTLAISQDVSQKGYFWPQGEQKGLAMGLRLKEDIETRMPEGKVDLFHSATKYERIVPIVA